MQTVYKFFFFCIDMGKGTCSALNEEKLILHHFRGSRVCWCSMAIDPVHVWCNIIWPKRFPVSRSSFPYASILWFWLPHLFWDHPPNLLIFCRVTDEPEPIKASYAIDLSWTDSKREHTHSWTRNLSAEAFLSLFDDFGIRHWNQTSLFWCSIETPPISSCES